jgi:hypothetical protein
MYVEIYEQNVIFVVSRYIFGKGKLWQTLKDVVMKNLKSPHK